MNQIAYPKIESIYRGLPRLPFVFGALLLVLTFSYIRYDLHRASTQFVRDFERQNYLEIGRSDILGLTTRLNSLLASLPWVCIDAGRDKHVFFSRSRGNCSSGLLREAVDLHAGPAQEIHIRFVLTLSNELRNASLIFLTSQTLMFLLAIWALRRAERVRTESESNLARLAAQVAHDIRSPLSALNVVLGDVSNLPEDMRQIIRSSIGRIQDVANDLLMQNRKDKNPFAITVQRQSTEPSLASSTATELLSTLVDSVITEKRLQYRSKLNVAIECSLTQESYGLFSQVNASEFKRVISNIISNAVDAVEDRGRVRLTLQRQGTDVQICVSDNGKGIPPNLLHKLGQRGVSFDKADGNGLGLFSAQEMLKAWRGKLELFSELGHETTAMITLPGMALPRWFAPSIQLTNTTCVVILDDDKSIHQIWDQRFGVLSRTAASQELDLTLRHFSTEQGITDWYRQNWNSDRNTIFLFDYELVGQKLNGLQLIEQLGISSQSYLVTARFEDPSIREQCAAKHIKLIPKNMAGIIPLEVSDSNTY